MSALLKGQLEDAAAKNNRSITAELTSRLERSFMEDGNLKAGALDLNGLLSAAVLLATGEDANDPAARALVSKAKEAARRLAQITYSGEADAVAVDGEK